MGNEDRLNIPVSVSEIPGILTNDVSPGLLQPSAPNHTAPPTPSVTSQFLPFILINHLAVAFVCALCRFQSAVFEPLNVGIHDTNTLAVASVNGKKEYRLRK